MVKPAALKKLLPLLKGIRLNDVNQIYSKSKSVRLQAGDHFVKEGSSKRDVAFIFSGLMRYYEVNEKGEEITTSLAWEQQFVAPRNVILFEQPSESYIQAIEPTHLMVINYDLMQEILESSPKSDSLRQYFMLQRIALLSDRVRSFVMLKPEERYLQLIEQNPSLVDRVPNKYIANIIGITPVSLSRIRNRIASQKK